MNDMPSLSTEDLHAALNELAMDLRWTWDHATDKVWRQLDPVLWELTHNPLVVLQTVSRDRISEVLADPLVQEIVQELIEARRQHALAPAWFQHAHPNSALTCVAYFSMEFMLSEALPIYSGGLGNVAGDHLKTASDLGVPVVGIGLLYQQGYSRQVINRDGSQQYVTPFNDPGQLPVMPVREANGEWLRIEVKLPGYSVWLRTWKVQVGRVTLYLLDSNDAANFPLHRGITNELYGGDAGHRLLQELLLGMGGWRLLKALGLQPQVCHLNEGHAAFLVIERALDFMESSGVGFDEALFITRSGNIFTTHTAIGAGFDLFPPDLLEQYLGDFIQRRLKISTDDFLGLGRKNPSDKTEKFNTAYLAINGCGFVNGVSRLHGNVSRHLFAELFPRWPVDEVPIGHVTNGVHMPTWDSPEADRFWTETCGKDRWLGALETLEPTLLCVPDSRLWQMRRAGKETFVTYIRRRYALERATAGMPLQPGENGENILDPSSLTLGFARRFVAYKRPNLLLHDRERLKKILRNKDRPVQIILAGKAHRGDEEGQAQIREWVRFIAAEGLQQNVVFLSDYDMLLSEHLVQGVDLWINTPRRPWEACGTSGMKVLVNGGLNFSELDGWWDEAYNPTMGWALGDRQEHARDGAWDEKEANELYTLLEEEVIPAFYQRNGDGVPEAWVHRMRESMAKLTPQYSANRSLREYLEDYYLPAADRFLRRSAGNGEKGKEDFWQLAELTAKWPQISFGELQTVSQEDLHLFSVSVQLNDVSPDCIKFELYANGKNGYAPVTHIMHCGETLADGSMVFVVNIPAGRPTTDYTPRITAGFADVLTPLECKLIQWQR
ncbi:MAG TPA: alpha-glucan family phosphorylase [Flavisolibacter sp.]|nr:alpha-glucan family phosphorylase [Flavisolibacter sp.]